MTDARRRGPGRGFWVGLGLAAVAGIAALAWLSSRPKSTATRIDPNVPLPKATGHVIGLPTAPVEIIEFADFECPGCGQFAVLTEPDVRTQLVNTGKARFRFMDFPLAMHKNSWDASLAASCAEEQGKFWEMHDQIFANQDRWNTEATGRPRSVLSDLAKGLGLDMSKYDECMDSERNRPKIQSTLNEGHRLQVASTPTFIINGTMVSGGASWDSMKRYVDEATARAAAAPAARPAADSVPHK